MASSLSRALDERLASDGASPLITFYDDATGERTELSATTLANWVSKTCGLIDSHGVMAGDDVGLWLPVHWQSAAILLACWRVGAVAVLAEEPVGLAFAQERRLDQAVNAADEVIGLALAPMAGRLHDLPFGAEDYAVEIPGHPDQWTASHPPPDSVALRDDQTWTADDLLARAVAIPHAGQRILTTASEWTLPSITDVLLGPLATGGSVVLVRNPDPAQAERRALTERATHQL